MVDAFSDAFDFRGTGPLGAPWLDPAPALAGAIAPAQIIDTGGGTGAASYVDDPDHVLGGAYLDLSSPSTGSCCGDGWALTFTYVGGGVSDYVGVGWATDADLLSDLVGVAFGALGSSYPVELNVGGGAQPWTSGTLPAVIPDGTVVTVTVVDGFLTVFFDTGSGPVGLAQYAITSTVVENSLYFGFTLGDGATIDDVTLTCLADNTTWDPFLLPCLADYAAGLVLTDEWGLPLLTEDGDCIR